MTNKLIVESEGIPEYYVVDGTDRGWYVIHPETSEMVGGPFNDCEDADFHAGYLDGQRYFTGKLK